MKLLFRNLSVIFFLLFIFASNGLAQRDYSDFLNQMFLQAVQGGDMEHIAYLLLSGVDLNTVDEFGRTAGMLAYSRQDPEILKFLIDKRVINTGEAGHICLDYILDVHIANLNQTQRFNAVLEQEEHEIELELSFSLRQSSHLALSVEVKGIGMSKVFVSPPPFFEREQRSQRGQRGLESLVGQAVRDGYKKLSDYLQDRVLESPQLAGTVRAVSGNRVSIRLGQTDFVQKDDVFHIYSNDNCHSPFGPPKAIARAIVVHEYVSMLEIQSANGRVQFGDVILSSDMNFHSRGEQENDDKPELVLKLNPIPYTRVTLSFLDDEAFSITSYIEESLAEEDATHGFQVVSVE